jgi:hypothetical protein
MECLENIVGLKGGCADINSVAEVYLNSYVGHSELSKYVDTKEFANVDDLFRSLRADSVREVLAEINSYMRPNYIAKQVVSTQRFGVVGTRLQPIAAANELRGILYDRCTTYPTLAYRVNRVGFIGQVTGNVVITYRDGLTGQVLGTDTVAAVAGQEAWLYVNRKFAVTKLLVTFDATATAGYKTRTDCYIRNCGSCGTKRVNAHVNAYSVTAPIGTPLQTQTVNDMGGLMLEVGMECDHTIWLCGIRQALALPILYKMASRVMQYAIDQTDRNNTRTVRDIDKLADRGDAYEKDYEKHMKSVLQSVHVPQDPICYVCRRQSGLIQMIP